MKTTKRLLTIFSVVTMTTFVSANAMAHSAHDHSTVPYKWALSKSLKVKIDDRLKSSKPTSMIGLSHLEQKKLEHYDINVGNKFNTEMGGINLLVKRTSAGMKIVEANRVEKIVYAGQIPIKMKNIVSRASVNKSSHVGHDHSNLPYEWTFSLATQDKIFRALVRKKDNALIGLNSWELAILKEYDIKPGNTFHTSIKGHQLMIEKTSSGFKVVDHKNVHEVAMVHHNNENM